MNKTSFISTGKKPTEEEWRMLLEFRRGHPDKAWKHGDTRADGKKFVQYNHRHANGERWATPESFAASVELKTRRYWENREESLAQSKKWREKNAEYKKLTDKKYRDDNKEKVSAHQKEYYEANKEKIKARSSEWYAANKDKAKLSGAARYKRNKPRIKEKAKEYHTRTKEIRQQKSREWFERNRASQMKKIRAWKRANRPRLEAKSKERAKADPLYALTMSVRARMRGILSTRGYTKKSKTQEIIGCSWADLKAHLESQFTEGMSWANRNEWHIDHRIPLVSAKTEEELLALCKYTNLQPLWAADNLKKWTKLPP